MWGAAFTYVGLWSIVAGGVVIVTAAVLRPTWRFVLACLVTLFCIWGGLLLVVGALAGD